MYYEVNEQLRPLAAGQAGSNIVGALSFAQAEGCPLLQGVTSARLQPLRSIHFCHADIYADMVIGTLAVPDKDGFARKSHVSGFCLQAGNLVFLDDSPFTEALLSRIMKAFVWHRPALASFFCAYLEQLIAEDLPFLERIEGKLAALETEVLHSQPQNFEARAAVLQHKISALHRYYAQLAELAAGLCQSPLFEEAERVTLDRFAVRCGHLESETQLLHEMALQLRTTYQAQIDLRQNKTMQVLTVVTTICMPITLITGWFGMNFIGMPELAWRYSYPVVIAFSIVVVLLCFWLCKKKKLL